MSTIAPERHKEEVIRHDDDFSFEAVPSKNRRSFWAVGFVMLGFTFFSASMSVGAKLGNGLNTANTCGQSSSVAQSLRSTRARWATSAQRPV